MEITTGTIVGDGLVDRIGEWDLNKGSTCTSPVDTRRRAIGVSNSNPYAPLRQKSRATPDTHITIQKIHRMVNSNGGHTPNVERF
jgi:hypothetical protein